MKAILQFGSSRFVIEGSTFAAFCEEVRQCVHPLVPIDGANICFMCNFHVFEEAAECEGNALTSARVSPDPEAEERNAAAQPRSRGSIHVYSQETFEAAEAAMQELMVEACTRREEMRKLGLIDSRNQRLCSLNEKPLVYVEAEKREAHPCEPSTAGAAATATQMDGTTESKMKLQCPTVPLALLVPIVVLDTYMATSAGVAPYYDEQELCNPQGAKTEACAHHARGADQAVRPEMLEESSRMGDADADEELPAAAGEQRERGDDVLAAGEGDHGEAAAASETDLQEQQHHDEVGTREETAEDQFEEEDGGAAPEDVEGEPEPYVMAPHRRSSPPGRANSHQSPMEDMLQATGPRSAGQATSADEVEPEREQEDLKGVREGAEEAPAEDIPAAEEPICEAEQQQQEGEESGDIVNGEIEGGETAEARSEMGGSGTELDEASSSTACVPVREAPLTTYCPEPNSGAADIWGSDGVDVAIIVTGKPLAMKKETVARPLSAATAAAAPANSTALATTAAPVYRNGRPSQSLRCDASGRAPRDRLSSTEHARMYQMSQHTTSALNERDMDVMFNLLDVNDEYGATAEAYIMRGRM